MNRDVISRERHSYAVLLAVLLAAALPMLALFFHGVQIFDVCHEFVAYRIGDALSLMFRDTEAVHPVQGIPNALLSKIIVNALYVIRRPNLAEAGSLQAYSALFFISIFAIVAGAAFLAWPRMMPVEQVGFAALAILPWCISPLSELLVAPEYWIAEYAYLLCSLAVLAALRERHGASDVLALVVGAWIGVGISIKISMIGIAPLLFLALPRRSWQTALIMIDGAVGAYLLLMFLYAGGRPGLTWQMLKFQGDFYLYPNASQQYSNWREALAANTPLAMIMVSATILAVAHIREPWRFLAAMVWIALLVFLIRQRPHQTSIASAMMCGLFLIVLLAPRANRVMLAGAAVSLLMLIPLLRPCPQCRWEPSKALDRPLAGDILFMPDNYWNAATPLQAFAYNGGLGLGRAGLNERGQLIANTPSLSAIFGRPIILLGGSTNELSLLETGVRQGMVVVWTRPPNDPGAPLMEVLKRAGATISEDVTTYRGVKWAVGQASISHPPVRP